VSKAHWATRRRQLLLGCASSLASSQLNPVSFKSLRITSRQFSPGLPGFLFVLLRFQYKEFVRYSAAIRRNSSRLLDQLFGAGSAYEANFGIAPAVCTSNMKYSKCEKCFFRVYFILFHWFGPAEMKSMFFPDPPEYPCPRCLSLSAVVGAALSPYCPAHSVSLLLVIAGAQ